MHVDKQRELFSAFLKESGLAEMMRCDSSVTVLQDSQLKYERINRYTVLLMKSEQMKDLLVFCVRHGIDLWLGADKLCVGFNFRGNMRLSAYSSVQPVIAAAAAREDRSLEVRV